MRMAVIMTLLLALVTYLSIADRRSLRKKIHSTIGDLAHRHFQSPKAPFVLLGSCFYGTL
jgi:hypothetical protein